jgi:CheY-like chemotaxis protein
LTKADAAMATTLDKDVSRTGVLIMDSNAFSRSMITGFLRGAGISQIADAPNLEQAIDRYQEVKPDVLILEWEEKGLDGLALTKEIRTANTSIERAVPIIITSSLASIGDVERARLGGVTEFAVKPMSARTIVSRIEQVLYQPRPFVVSDTYGGPCRRRTTDPYFMGPFRRADDSKLDLDADPVEQAIKVRLSGHLSRLAFELRSFLAGERSRVRYALAATQTLQDAAREVGDGPVETAAASLRQYLTAVGADPRLDQATIEMHVAALGQLIGLPSAEGRLREQVAHGLGKVVAKRLNATRRDGVKAR